jgi:hypothetical protein
MGVSTGVAASRRLVRANWASSGYGRGLALLVECLKVGEVS